MTSDASSSRRRTLPSPLAAGVVALAVLLLSEPHLAIVWDEGYTLLRLDRVRAWIDAVRDPQHTAATWRPARLERLTDRRPTPRPNQIDTREKLFDGYTLAWFWPFARDEPHGHPPFYAIVGLAGDVLAPRANALTRARVGTMLAFSLATAALFAFAARRWGTWSAVAASAAWLLHPHLFALAHYATYDALLASLWLGVTIVFGKAARLDDGACPMKRPCLRATVGYGLLLGCALATKFTGWLLPVPLLAWAVLERRRQALVAWVIGGVTALLVFYVLCPPLWTDPVGGSARFFESNLSRSSTIPIKTQFLGHIYETPTGSLPWYNTLVWLFMATPVVFLLLAVVGAARAVWRWRAEKWGLLFLFSGALVFFLRSMPHTPGHDGTRQLAAGLGMLAPLCGLGASVVLAWRPRLGRWMVGLGVVEAAISVALCLPVPLSYFSPIVGGLPGATALGMEPTYYWDALTPAALHKIDELPYGPNEGLFIAANPTAWYYREAGQLHTKLYPAELGSYSWYVLQNRPGAMNAGTRELVRRLGQRREFIVQEKFGVPLIWAFSRDEVERVLDRAGLDEKGRRRGQPR